MKKILLSLVLAAVINAGTIVPFFETIVEANESRGYKIELREKLGGDDKLIEGKTGVDLMMDYFGDVYKFAASLIGIVCVLIMVVSGVQISMGGANNSLVSAAKDRIIQALFSLILLFGSYLVLRTVNPAFFTS